MSERKWKTLAEAREERSDKGLQCPRCHCRHFEVWRTVPRPGGIRRERICRNCGKKVMTFEATD